MHACGVVFGQILRRYAPRPAHLTTRLFVAHRAPCAMLILIEITIFAIVVCTFHRLKDVLSIAPFYALIGLFEAFLFVADKSPPGGTPITVQFFGADTAFLGYTLFLPLLLASMVIVYALEGTKQARRVLVSLVALHLVHAGIDILIGYHAAHPPPGKPDLSQSPIAEYSLSIRAFSLTAFIADTLVILIVYQFLVNTFKKIPLAVHLFIALVCAMCSDAVVFGLLFGLPISFQGLQLVEKAQAAVAVAVPVSIYLGLQFRRNKDDLVDGTVRRGALEIIDLRRQVQEAQDRLKKERARYLYVRDAFSRYVSSDVVDSIIEDPERVKLGGELKHVTVLFADIAGYSTFSEALSPTDVISLLNRYFERVSTDILSQKGMINEFEGDAVLAIFGAPVSLPDHAERALRSAQAMLATVEDLNREWALDGTLKTLQKTGVERLAIRIGLHSGPVVAGNIGSQERLKYAVIGDTVNTASRVEGLNKVLSTQLLLTHSTVELLPEDHTFPLKDLGHHTVKGRSEPVHAYTIEG